MIEAVGLKPIKLLRENLAKTEVAKYYLEIEFSKLFKNVATELINETISNLSENKVWALLEAMSFTYHLNGVFFKLSKEGYFWNEEIWNVEDLLFTGMDSNVNKVIFSKEINGDAVKFKNYLLNYFETYKDNDPEKLFSYKPTGKPMEYTKLIATEKEGKIAMLDGSHRLTEMLLNGIKEVNIFVGHPTDEIPEKDKRYLVGSSTLILLTILYKQGNEEEKKAVLTIVQELIDKTLDGKEATRKYWVERMKDDEIRNAGETLLKAPKF
jgi:hypothetical protein